jgi:hypothetical protein
MKMNRSTVWLIAGLVGAVAIIAFLRLRAAPHPRPAPAAVAGSDRPSDEGHRSPVDNDNSALKADLYQLHEEVANLRAQLAARDGTPPPEPSSKPIEIGGPAHTPEEQSEQEARWHAHMNVIAERFRAEPKDAKWAQSTTAEVQAAANANEAIRDAIRGIECHSESCKVQIFDDGTGGVQKALPLFVQSLGETMPTVQADHEDDGQGHLNMTLYMSRLDMLAQSGNAPY